MLCYYKELMEINVFFDEGLEDSLDVGWLEEIAKEIIADLGIGRNVEMGLVIANQKRAQQLNKAYRGKDVPTDVLAFTMLAGSGGVVEAAFINPPDGVKHLGEVIISYPQAIIQAKEHRHSIKKEVAILIIHGILHLLGYNHIEDEPAQEMKARESAILATIEGGLN